VDLWNRERTDPLQVDNLQRLCVLFNQLPRFLKTLFRCNRSSLVVGGLGVVRSWVPEASSAGFDPNPSPGNWLQRFGSIVQLRLFIVRILRSGCRSQKNDMMHHELEFAIASCESFLEKSLCWKSGGLSSGDASPLMA
jgi:hypothetical protein